MDDNINTLFSSRELEKINNIKESLGRYSLLELYEEYNSLDSKVSSKKTKSKHSSSSDSKKHLKIYAIKDLIDGLEKAELEKNPDIFIDSSYINYPLINDKLFQHKILLKEEFNVNKVDKIDYNFEDKCLSSNFNLSNYQRFVKTFMSPNTPYNGLLLFHGTGVGKTCSAVQIAEQFKDFYKHRIRVILSQSIESGWKRNIYNPDKYSNQCTRNTYKHLLDSDIKESIIKKDVTRQVNKIIKTKYEFYGYQKFSNVVNQIKKSRSGAAQGEEKLSLEISAIRDAFSNSLLIIDEAHNIRLEEGSSNKNIRNIIKIIDEVITHSINLKIVLLTATPMFNRANEIIWLLNILLKNDKKNPIRQDLFSPKGDITDEGKSILIDKSRGYISYVRGEDPITFPIRLYAGEYLKMEDVDIYNNKLNNYPKLTFKRNPILPEDSFKFLSMKICPFQKWQLKVYNDLIKTHIKHDTLSIMDDTKCTQISNIVYSVPGKTHIREYYGQRGFLNIFNKIGNSRYSYKSEILKEYNGPILTPDRIHNYSSKISTIINSIVDLERKKPRTGVIFIYSRYLYAGILPLAIVLEHMGFEKYGTGKSLLNYPEYKKSAKKGETKMEPLGYNSLPKSESKGKGSFKRGKYIILSGDHDLSKNKDKELKVAISENNKDGGEIKIILGTEVSAEGIDLKYVREVHIMDPWRHLNKIEQIIGRGIRYCSHSGLDIKKRNVTVYLHTGVGDDPDVESTDAYIYRQAEIKTRQIGKVEKILKINAIDCYLFHNSNIIKKNELPRIKILKTYQNKTIPNIDIYDKSFSKICSYTEECDYKCACDEFINPDIIEETNKSTFNPKMINSLLYEIMVNIKNLYSYDYIYSIKEVIELVKQTKLYDDKYIKLAINELLSNGNSIHKKIYNDTRPGSNIISYDDIYKDYIVYDKNNIEGYLIKATGTPDNIENIYCIFQPLNLKSMDITMYDRINNHTINNEINPKYIDLSDTIKQTPIDKDIGEISNYDDIIKYLEETYEILGTNRTPIKKDSLKNRLSDLNECYNKEDNLKKIIGLLNMSEYDKQLNNYILDRLLYNEKHIILSNLFIKISRNIPLTKIEIRLFNNYSDMYFTSRSEINTIKYKDLLKIKDYNKILKGFYLFNNVGKSFTRIFFKHMDGQIRELKVNLSKLESNINKYKMRINKYIHPPDYFGYIDISKNKINKIYFKYKMKGPKILPSQLPGVMCGSRDINKEYEIIKYFDEEFFSKYASKESGRKNKKLLCFVIEMILRIHGYFYKYEELSYII